MNIEKCEKKLKERIRKVELLEERLKQDRGEILFKQHQECIRLLRNEISKHGPEEQVRDGLCIALSIINQTMKG